MVGDVLADGKAELAAGVTLPYPTAAVRETYD